MAFQHNRLGAALKSIEPDARALAAALHDGIALCLAFLAATMLLDVDGVTNAESRELLQSFVIAVPIQIAINFLFGLYQGIWRYTSLPNIQRIVVSVLTGWVAISVALHALGVDNQFGYREYILYPLFLASFMSLSRVAYRSFKEWSLYGRGGEQGTAVIIMGAGDAAVGLVKELTRSHEWRVVGFLDDDEKKRGRLLHGVRVLGPLDDLPRFAQRLKLRHAIVAMPSVPYKVRRRVVEICKRARVAMMTVPTLNNVMGGKGSPARIRKIAVEDLMKREAVTLDDAGLHELLTNQVVMVTGAGGSIGSELCRQIAAYQPAMLVLYEMNEYAMYKVDEQLREAFPELPLASGGGGIKNDLPTHPEMVRYFMSIPEAARLVLQAGCMGLGGEVLVLDMGEPIKIVDLARDMIRLSELSENEIRIVYTGLRPGEKLFEELLADDEHTRPTPHPKLRIAKAREVDHRWIAGLLEWLDQDRIPNHSEVRRDLKRCVPAVQSQVRPRLTAIPNAKTG